jgi:hypothetical protein
MRKVNYCRHVKQDGVLCGSPPLRGENYCHFHLRYKRHPLRTRRSQQRLGGLRSTRRTAFSFKALQANLKRVERMLASGTCRDPKQVRLLRCALRMAISNLRYVQEKGGVCGGGILVPATAGRAVSLMKGVSYDKPLQIKSL